MDETQKQLNISRYESPNLYIFVLRLYKFCIIAQNILQ